MMQHPITIDQLPDMVGPGRFHDGTRIVVLINETRITGQFKEGPITFRRGRIMDDCCRGPNIKFVPPGNV